jgi:flavin-dependent dehydrogenase
MSALVAGDVVIVGGGPAGAATALALARLGIQATLLEAAAAPRWRVGETLPGVASVLLRELGVFDLFLADGHLPCQAIRSAWGSAELRDRLAVESPYGGGWHLDRRRFDELLMKAAARAGATVLCGMRVESVCKSGTDWLVETRRSASRDRMQARFLVDATGRGAWLARRVGACRLRHDRLLAVVQRYQSGRGWAGDQPFAMIEALRDGWWYSTPLPDGTLLASFFTDADLFVRGDEQRLIANSLHTARRLEGWSLRAETCIVSAASHFTPNEPEGTWLAVGDAAAAFDPLASQGLCFALRSGLEGAQAIARARNGDSSGLSRYASGVQAIYRRYLTERAAYYQAEHRWPEAPFWSRRQSSEER